MGNERDWQNLKEELGDAQSEGSPNEPSSPGPAEDSSGPEERPDAVTIDLGLDEEPSGGAGDAPSGDEGSATAQTAGNEPALDSNEEAAPRADVSEEGPGESAGGGGAASESSGPESEPSQQGEAGAAEHLEGGGSGDEPPVAEGEHPAPPSAEGTANVSVEPPAPAVGDDEAMDVETLEIDLEAVEEVPKSPSLPPLPSSPPAPPPPGGGLSGAKQAHVRRNPVEEFRALATGDRTWEQRLVQGELEALSDKKRRAAYYYELGELEEHFFGSESNAAKAYREAVRLHAGLLVNLWAVRRVLSKHKKWRNVLKLINAELKLADNPAHRRDLLLEKGALLEGPLQDETGAAEAYRQLLEEDPTNLEALMSLEALVARAGDSAELIDLARRQIDATSSVGRKVALLVEMERAMRRTGADYDTCRTVLEEAVDLVGPERDFFREWELLATLHGRTEELYDVLERHAKWSLSSGAWVEAVAVVRRMVRLALGSLQDPRRAASALGIVAGREEAFAVVARERLFLAWMTLDWDAILELTEQLLSSDSDMSEAERLDLQMSRVVALAAAGRPEDAESVFSGILEEGKAGEDLEIAVFRLVFAAKQGSRQAISDALGAVLDVLGAAEEDRFRALSARLSTAMAYLRFAGALAEENLDEQALVEVAELCKRSLMADQDAALALRLYEEVLIRTGDLSTLADLLEARAQRAEGPELLWVLEGLAWASFGELADPARGARALERLAEGSEETLMAAFRLAFLSEKNNDSVQAALFWRKVADATVDSEIRVEALLRAADLLWVHQGESAQALECLEEVLQTVPGDPTALFQAERILTHEGRWEDLVSILRREAGSVSEAEIEERLLLKAADILDLKLDRADEAEEIYRDVLMRFPDRPSAAWLLAHVWRRSGHWEDLVDHWVDRAGSTGDAAAMAEAARVCEYELNQLERAEGFYAESFESRPWDLFLLERMVTLAYASHNPGRAVDAVKRFLESREQGDEDQTALLTEPLVEMLRAEVALLEEFTQKDPASGWEVWADLVDEDGLLGRMAKWAGLRWSLRSSDWAGRGAYGARLGASLQGLLGEVVALRAAVHRVVAEPGVQSGEALGDRKGDLTEAAAPLLHAPSEWSAEFLEKRVSQARTDEDRGWALLRKALVSMNKADWTVAYEAVCRAAEVMGNEPAVLSVGAELASRAGQVEAKALWLGRLGQVWKHDEMASESLVAAARAFESVGRIDDALWAWRQAVARNPHREAFEGLAGQLEQQKRWKELADVLTIWLDQETDGARLVDLYFRRAQLREKHLDDPVGAATDYHRVLSKDASRMDAAYRLGMLYARDGNGEKAVEFLERVRQQDGDEALVWKARIALAEVYERLFEDDEQARAHYRDLVDLRDDVDSWERWLGFSVRGKHWEDAEEAFSRIDERLSDNAARAKLAMRQGLFYRDFMVNRDKAAKALERARSFRPEDMEPVRLLVGLYQDMVDKDGVGRVVASAFQEQMRLLGRDSSSSRLYRNILELADLAEDPDRKFFTAAILDLLGQLEDDVQSWYAARRKDRFSLSKNLEESLLSNSLFRPEVRESGALDVGRAIGFGVAKLEGKQPSELGLGRSDKVNPKKAAGTLKEILDLAERFGVTLDTVYSWDREGLTWMDGEDGAILVVGKDWVSRRLEASDLFRLGRDLAAARVRAVTISQLPADKVELYLTAATVSVVSDYQHDLPRDRVAETAKMLTKAMPRRDRKALAVAAVSFARRPIAAQTWLRNLILTFDRAGLLLSGDLGAAVREICRREGVEWRTAEDGAAQLEKCADVGELFVYAVSETFAELRKELGMTWKL